MQKRYVSVPVYVPDWLYFTARRLKRWWRRSSGGRKNLSGDRDIEWSWVAARIPEGPGLALDFGPGGSHLSLIAAQRGFDVTAIDLEAVERPYVHPQVTYLVGDVLQLDLASDSFDLVLNCSTTEHVGLAGRYGVTVAVPDGDLEAMRRLHGWMKPGGRMLLTVPAGRDRVYVPLHRVYGRERLPRLIENFTVAEEQYFVKNDRNQWRPAERDEALDFESDAGSWDGSKNVYALACLMLVKPSGTDARGGPAGAIVESSGEKS